MVFLLRRPCFAAPGAISALAMAEDLALWRPRWPAPARVQACMTLRAGGVSQPPWAHLNLANHVGDAPLHVAENRARLRQALQIEPVYLEQVHGKAVMDIGHPVDQPADACLTQQPGLACTVMVADCLPVLLCDVQGQWVAAAHAGWRGLAGQAGQGVLESVVMALRDRGVRPQDLLAWLGPCIGPLEFEVGPEVVQALNVDAAQDRACFRPGRSPDRFMADLALLARHRLHRLGVSSIFGNDSRETWCTVRQSSLFFSHRRDARVWGTTGRMAALVWLNG